MLTIKNYKKLEGWSHNYKDIRIGQIIEGQSEYHFRIAYNSTPYIIKIFRQGTIANEYEMVLRDGSDITQFGRTWVMKNSISIDRITNTFEKLIMHHKPKAQSITGNTNFNNPF